MIVYNCSNCNQSKVCVVIIEDGLTQPKYCPFNKENEPFWMFAKEKKKGDNSG